MTLNAGKELGHYKIVRKLGTGGMADVYEAQDLKLGRTVALKILPPELMRDPQMVARFQTEVRAAASLNHRSIVTVFEVGEQDGVHFYSMGLLTGGDLRARIRAGALRAIDALAILRELCGAFEHAHGRGFVHRDVKPENVMFDEEGLPVLTDFGIAKALGSSSSMTGTGVAIGTPRYFSPEQARGKPVDARSDLYSLGIILHEMLTGKPPYDGEDPVSIIMKHVNDPIPVLPDEHAHLQPLLEQLLAKDPAHRVASAKELRKQIAGVGGFASLTPQPINLGEESELVQRLLSGESSAYYTPTPTSVPATSKARSEAPTRLMPVVSHPGAASNRAGGAAPKGAPPRKAPVEQIIPYRGKIAPSPAKAGQSQPKAQPQPAGKGMSFKPLIAATLLVVAGLFWISLWQKQVQEAARTAKLAPAPQAKPPASEPAAPAAVAAPAVAPTPAPAPPAAGATPTVTTPTPMPAPRLAPARVEKPAAAAQPKLVPAPAPATKDAVAPAPQAAPKPEPVPQPTVAPAPTPVEQPVAAKPQPAPAPAPAEPAKAVDPEPEASTEEDDFLRQRAEQLKLERERREAAKKKAAEAAERKQQQEQQQQAPAEGAGSEPAESPPPQ